MKKLNKDNSSFDNSVEAYACGCSCGLCSCVCDCAQGCGIGLGPSTTPMYQSTNGVFSISENTAQNSDGVFLQFVIDI
jgi:putative bacteriocin precursor